MSEIDEVVRRLADIADELLALDKQEYAARFKLETERDGLRYQAADFRQPKDARTSTEQLRAELAERQKQLEAIQASTDFGRGCVEHPLGAKNNGTMYLARMSAQGAPSVVARIAELKQELARR